LNSLALHPYDIFVLAVLAAATLYGLWKGVAWQVASIASLVISTLVAGRYGAALAPYLSHHAPWNRFLAMLVLYLATSAAIWMLFHLVAQLIDRIHLRDFDSQLGAILGFAKGLLLCVVVTFFAVTLSESARQSILHSPSGYYMAKLIHNAGPLLPREVGDLVGKYLDELDRKLDPATADRSWQGGPQQPPSAQPLQPIPWSGDSKSGQPAAARDPFPRPPPWNP
jgi:membrane protein required for colicin V production